MSNKDVKGAIEGLVKKLPNSAAHAMLGELGLDSAQEGSRAHQVKAVLIDHLNAKRPNRVRRLFTSSFEPFLTGDINLYRTSVPIPGLILRTDIAALWHYFSEAAFPEIAQEATRKIDDLCQRHLVDAALEMPEAQNQLKIMQDATVKHIDQVLDKPKELDKLLKALNQARIPEIEAQTVRLNRVTPVNPRQLRLWRDIMAENEIILTYVDSFLKKLASAEKDLRAGIIERTMMQMREELANANVKQDLGFLLPVTVINVSRDYTAVADYLRIQDLYEDENATIAEAIIGHLEAVFSAMIRRLSEYFGTVTREDHGIAMTDRDRKNLDGLLENFANLLEAINLCEFYEHPRTKPLFDNAWKTLRPNVDSMVLSPTSMLADVLATAKDLDAHSGDFESALWILSYIWRWHKITANSESFKLDFSGWRNDLVDDLEFAFRDANRVHDEHDEIGLLMHLVRINKILNVVGSDITPWISAGSKNFLKITQRIFDDGLEIDEEARPIIGAYIANVRSEVRQIMSWKNPELEDLVEKAAAYGF